MEDNMDTEKSKSGNKSEQVYKGEQTRFADYSFGNLQTQNLEVSGDMMMSGIAMGNPVDGGTVKIPDKISTVIIQSIYPYTQLTITMPNLPVFGKTIRIVSTVDVTNLTLSNGTFGTVKPTSLKASVPVRFIFAGSWFNI